MLPVRAVLCLLIEIYDACLLSCMQSDVWGIGVCLLVVIYQLSKRLQQCDVDIPRGVPLGKLQDKNGKIFETALRKMKYCEPLHQTLSRLLKQNYKKRPDAAEVVKVVQSVCAHLVAAQRW